MIDIPAKTRIGNLTPEMISQINQGLTGERYGQISRCEKSSSWHYTAPGGFIITLHPDAIINSVWELAVAMMNATAPKAAKAAEAPLTIGDVVQCFEDPVTQEDIEGDCILIKKLHPGYGNTGLETWLVRFAADGIDGPEVQRAVHVKNRYNTTEEAAI